MTFREGDVFEAAKQRVSVGDLAGRYVKLVRAGKQLRGPCPLCGAGAKSKSTPFAVNPDKRSWKCWGCEKWGSVVDLYRELEGGTDLEAARALAGGEFKSSAPVKAAPKADDGPTSSDKIAEALWAEGRPLAGTLGWRYLAGRGIAAPVIEAAAPSLRYHPFAKWGWDERARDWIKAPAIIVRAETDLGPTGGVEAIYLARDGGKAVLPRPKLMWGRQNDRLGRPGGAWLIGPDGADFAHSQVLGGEGVETALSMATLAIRGQTFCGIDVSDMPRVFAALSLNRLQGGVLRDADGCMDVADPQGDPERPAFTWPEPADAPWGEILIGVDRDMGELRVKGRTGRGKPCNFTLGAEARARLCARLAVEAWTRSGAKRVRAVAPRPGHDFNDEVRG